MSGVERDDDGFVVDAALLARAFDLSADEIRVSMKAGQITSRLEAGRGTDEGRWRITFFNRGRALQLTVDGCGQVLAQADLPLRARARPVPAR